MAYLPSQSGGGEDKDIKGFYYKITAHVDRNEIRYVGSLHRKVFLETSFGTIPIEDSPLNQSFSPASSFNTVSGEGSFLGHTITVSRGGVTIDGKRYEPGDYLIETGKI